MLSEAGREARGLPLGGYELNSGTQVQYSGSKYLGGPQGAVWAKINHLNARKIG